MIALCHCILQLQYLFLMNEGNNSVCMLFNHYQLIYHIHYLIKILNFSLPITPYLNTTSQKKLLQQQAIKIFMVLLHPS